MSKAYGKACRRDLWKSSEKLKEKTAQSKELTSNNFFFLDISKAQVQ